MGDVSLDRPVKAEPAAAGGIAQGHRVMDLMSAGWTDERHTLYISSMEASFIHQLYNHRHNTNQDGSSGDGCKVLHGGLREKLKFERTNACARIGDKKCLPASSCIRHFKRRGCSSNARADDGAETSAGDHESGIRTIQGRTPMMHGRELGACKRENPLDENTEVSDQNFADDEVEVDEESSNACQKRKLSSTSIYCTRMIK